MAFREVFLLPHVASRGYAPAAMTRKLSAPRTPIAAACSVRVAQHAFAHRLKTNVIAFKDDRFRFKLRR